MNQRQIDILEIFTEASRYGKHDIARKQVVRLSPPVQLRLVKPGKVKSVKMKRIYPIPYRLTLKALDRY